jgi:putative peptidoglycan lipid II flippase
MSKAKAESLGRSSGKISAATAISRMAGLVRETVFAYLLGSGFAADAFFAATRIPNLLRDLFAEGALAAAFVPVVSEKLAKDDRESVNALTSRMMVALGLVVGAVVLIGVLAAPWIVRGLAPGFAEVPGKTELTTLLVRWTFPYLWLISLAALVAGTLNAMHRFGVPASAPILFNVGHIATAVIFYSVFDPPVMALAVGVTVGAFAQLVFQWPALKRAGCAFRPAWPWRDPDVRRVFKLMLPVVLGLAALQLNNLATTLIATLLPEGSLSYLTYAFRLMHFPLGVFAVAIGTAVLPRASAQVALKDHAALSDTYSEGVQLAFFLVLPAALFLVLFPEAIVGVIYQRGAFSAADTISTAAALRFYAIGLVGYTGVRVTAPFFYAHNDTGRPMRIAMAAVAVNIVLNIVLAVPLGFRGLALANALSGTLNFVLLAWLLQKRYGIVVDRRRMKTCVHLALDGFAAALVSEVVWSFWNWGFAERTIWTRAGELGLLGVIFLAVYLWRAAIPGSLPRRLLSRLKRRR